MRKSRILWGAILESKPPAELGVALRDGLPFDKLKDESVATVAMVVSLYEKGLKQALEELAKIPDPAPTNGAVAAPSPAPAVSEPTTKKRAEGSAKP